MTTHTSNDINQLNSFLRGELAAVETYEQCIAKVDDGAVISQLRLLQTSHRRRTALLTTRIRELGGEAVISSGVWGEFAKLVEKSAGAFGARSALSTLEQGEDHGLNDYKHHLTKLSPLQQRFIEVEVLPEQLRSHDILVGIERAFKQSGSRGSI